MACSQAFNGLCPVYLLSAFVKFMKELQLVALFIDVTVINNSSNHDTVIVKIILL